MRRGGSLRPARQIGIGLFAVEADQQSDKVQFEQQILREAGAAADKLVDDEGLCLVVAVA